MQSGIRNVLRTLTQACRLDWMPLAICGVFIATSLLLLASKGINGFHIRSVVLNFKLFAICILFGVTVWFFWALVRERPESPVRFSKNFVARNLSPTIFARHLPIVIALCVFMPVFSAMKSSISLFADYSWDATFTRWDELIHFGDAWRLVHPLVGRPAITFFLNMCYNFWIVLIYGATVYFGLRLRSPILRQRFLISHFLCWSLLGVGGAIALASVGPAFVGPLLGDRHFDPLTAYLAEANTHYRIISVEVQARLVDKFRGGSHELGAGITAMPSMHISMMFLFVLAFRHVSKLAGILSAAFFVLILIGSVHLGYHYAIDGYVSIVATALIWRVAGWWVAKPTKIQTIAA